MGAIGDYIHFGRAGYNKHGITRNGDKDSYSFEAQKELMRKRSKMLTSDVSEERGKEVSVLPRALLLSCPAPHLHR